MMLHVRLGGLCSSDGGEGKRTCWRVTRGMYGENVLEVAGCWGEKPCRAHIV
ncbi:hypothetical protein Sjap_014453 [Stephania japonica]|uniref:Uncharacterized protein n=1 Tax=Stephania japonica TaxID=461633 RepID=A0AAP0IHA6_9MAGN